MSVDYRFPRGRWESCPIQDPAVAIALMGDNYDLRIDGEIRSAGAAPEHLRPRKERKP